MLSGLFTSTLMQQAVRYEVTAAESHGIDDIATVDRATTFSTYDGDHLMIGTMPLIHRGVWDFERATLR